MIGSQAAFLLDGDEGGVCLVVVADQQLVGVKGLEVRVVILPHVKVRNLGGDCVPFLLTDRPLTRYDLSK